MENIVVICGASASGQQLSEKLITEKKHLKIIFADNNIRKIKSEAVMKISELTDEYPIYIASHAYIEIYKQLLKYVDYKTIKAIYLDGILIDLTGIDRRENLVAQLDQYVQKELRIRYCNEAYNEIEARIKSESLAKIARFQKTNNLYSNICAVSLELSNICNYAMIHPKCPAYYKKEKTIMPKENVIEVLDELSEMEYNGMIQFTAYNEPLIDPRLFTFLEYVNNHIPKAYVRIYSNGFYLNQTMVDELEEAGVAILCVTAYGNAEWDRLTKLKVSIPYEVHMCEFPNSLDDRKNIYEQCETAKCNEPCMSLMSLHIHSDGKIAMCCLDWKADEYLPVRKEHGMPMKNILEKEEIKEDVRQLLKGDRKHTICKNCTWSIMEP